MQFVMMTQENKRKQNHRSSTESSIKYRNVDINNKLYSTTQWSWGATKITSQIEKQKENDFETGSNELCKEFVFG